MYRWAGIFLAGFCGVGCQATSKIEPLPQDELIRAYFNHRQTDRTYKEPYRQLERSGDNLEAVIIEAISQAQISIDLAVQELNLPGVARALAAKQQEGVRVRIILDNNYSRSWATLSSPEVSALKPRDRQKYQQYISFVDLNRDGHLSAAEINRRDALKILQQAGVEVIDDTADGSRGSGLMHHKFMVIDRQILVLGSANFTWSGLFGDPDNLATRGNINHLLRIDQPQVASLFGEEFDYMWSNTALGSKSQFGLAKPWREPQSVKWQNTEVVVQFAPTSNRRDWNLTTNGLIGREIEAATESIDIALFVFSEQELADRLQRQFQQGIKIKAVFDRSFAYRYYSELLDLLGVFALNQCKPEANNNPWVNPLNTAGSMPTNYGDKLHHKFTIIDQETVISGSQNWSAAANNRNDEAVIIIRNATVVKHFDREFLRLFKDAELGVDSRLKSQLEKQQVICK
ncbi:MAG: phospholipase D-like domain-containing protein [Cyanobacteria bacterium J06623_7]